MAQESSTDNNSDLSQLFDATMKIIRELDTTDMESNSPAFQVSLNCVALQSLFQPFSVLTEVRKDRNREFGEVNSIS